MGGYSKYNACPCIIDGIRFASQSEAKRYGELKLLERAGKIVGLTLQPIFRLYAGIVYVGDFEYYEGANRVVEDVKGVQTDVFKLKRKLFEFDYPDIDFRVIPV